MKINYLIKVSIILFVFMTSCRKESDDLRIIFKGSNTFSDLVNEISEPFNKKSIAKIQVLGGGSEEAIKEFTEGNLFNINSSRMLTEEEIIEAEKQHNKNVRQVIIGLDAIAIIVNPKLGIEELNLTQISEILSGKKTNWKDFGGPNLKITIYGRKETSGTYHFMRDKFSPKGFCKNIIEKNNSKELVKAVKADLSGFSYVDLACISNKDHFPLPGIWTINIAIEGANSISPFEKTEVLNGNYPLSRPLYQYIVDNKNETINSFIEFELSEIGQNIVERNGFFRILPMHVTLNKENGF